MVVWGIDTFGKDFLDKYWDYNKNTVNPWEISRCANKPKVWIKCQEKDYHGSYPIICNGFINKVRCPYCHSRGSVHKIHKLDSLGSLFLKSAAVWSNKNEKTPFEYSPFSIKEVWWKCPDGKHEDYKRKISDSNTYKFRCPECQYSKGEDRIGIHLINNNWKKIIQEEYEKLLKINEDNYYIPQKTFNRLLGLGGKLLSYDFYIPKLNLLIEYQGDQHEKPIDFKGKGKKYAEEQFEIQKEHDKRKKEYALQNGYNFLEIWYWEFDNIEEIINNYINV